MGPMIFYMDGLKEAMKNENGSFRLMGAGKVAQSVSEHSITLLVDVTTQSLVAHTAEIDYLDPERPLVLMFPAQPLFHNHHYAVAVVNALDNKGERLPSSSHLTELLSGTGQATSKTTSDLDAGRGERYRSTVVPIFLQVAPWLDLTNDPGSLQLLFDFHTVSATSQLGPVRSVRDGTLSVLNGSDWNWLEHIHVTKQVDYECGNDGNFLARTIYADMDVPWFLDNVGPGHRSARLDADRVASGQHLLWGKAKFVAHIPCSIRNAIGKKNNNEDIVQAVVEYGHGLFFGLEESSEKYLQEMAHENRYVITAMDFRGMSASDLLIVAKTLLAQPSLFEAVRDNLIQGYGAKFALQHFTQHGLFATEWFRFEDNPNTSSSLPDGGQVTRVYYGNSQGGILGAGYSALAGPTLLDRAVLGVPGTPFALVMSRSAEFAGYDHLMLLLMYNNRHVRMLLCLVQMAWDSVEGSGVLAPPIEEPFPPTLLQAGLGDPIVPSLAAEALARGYGAVLIPNNPRGDIYEIPYPIEDGRDNASLSAASYAVTLTEIMYADEYVSLPTNDVLPHENLVHVCLRRDPAMTEQMTEFINTGNVLDVCVHDGCQRLKADCF
uniref:Uncharacterized protein n=1 Tax=Amphora coffeiformis TaxID=265554 RepID=A0A7S3LA23_9STRA